MHGAMPGPMYHGDRHRMPFAPRPMGGPYPPPQHMRPRPLGPGQTGTLGNVFQSVAAQVGTG